MFRQHLIEGGKVWVQGIEFYVRDLRIVEAYPDPGFVGPGIPVARFKGECTDHSANNSIRHTPYNGGTYGGNSLRFTW